MRTSARRVRLLVLAGLMSTVLPAVGAHSATPHPVGDWLLIRVTPVSWYSGEGYVTAGFTDSLTGRGALLLGLGESVPYQGRRLIGVSVLTQLNTDGAIELSTSHPAGGMSVSIPNPSRDTPTHGFVSGSVPRMLRGEHADVLVFETNATFRLDSVHTSKDIRATVIMGRGARAIRYADPHDGGVAASVASTGAAFEAVHLAHPGAGIVGAVSQSPLLVEGMPEAIRWRGPAGVRGSAACAAIFSCYRWFAGPPGPWEWQWSGLREDHTQTPSLAGYAPIGRAWRDFVPDG